MKNPNDTTPVVTPADAGEATGVSISDTPAENAPGIFLTEADLLAALKAEPDEYTDQWAADEVAKAVRGRIRYVAERERFYVWDGTRWREDALNEAPRRVSKTLTYLSDRARQERRSAASDGERKRASRFVRAAQGLTLRNRVLRLLEEHPDVVESVESFDQNPYALNTPAGVYHLGTGERSDPDPESLCAMCTAVEPEAGEPEMWLRFLEETTLHDGELVGFLKRWLGYLATGLNTEKYLLIGVGRSDSGKTVFNNVVSQVLGSYHANIPQGALLAKGGNRHPADLAAFVGARVATSSEVPARGARWRSDVVKQITGGDTLSVRKMRENFYEIEPRCRLMLFSNHTPSTGDDAAMLRRIIFVPFDNTVPLEEQDRHLADKLVEIEGGKILNWILEGAESYLSEGLGEFPDVVEAATEQYRESEDRLALFFRDACDLDIEAPGERYSDTSGHLYDAWRVWCQENGYDRSEVGTQTAFTQMLRREAEEDYGLQYTSNATHSDTGARGRGFHGVQVKPSNLFEAPASSDSEEGSKTLEVVR